MFNAREQMAKDVHKSLTGEWGLPVELTGPDGTIYKYDATSLDPANPSPLLGQVTYAAVSLSLEAGEVIVNKPVAVLSRASLVRVPEDEEIWYMRFPTDPSMTAELKDFAIGFDQASEGGRSLGFIRFYPTKLVQS